MPSSYTTRNRLEMQNPGENDNAWGERLNERTIDLTDFAMDGWTKFTLSTTKTLSTASGTADEARARVIQITGGTGGTVTIPAVEKAYLVKNGASGNVTFTLGSGTTVVIASGASQWVFTDGANCYTIASVALTGAQTIAGLKTFTNGISINGQTLSGLTAAGKAVAEGANAAAQRTSLELGNVATIAKATTAQVRAAAGDAAVIADNLTNASAIVGLTDAATVAVNWTSGVNFDVALTANRALGNPTNVVVGTVRTIMVKGNSSTDRTLTFGSNYKGFIPSLTDIDDSNFYLLSLYAYTSTHIVVSVLDGGP